MSAILSRSKESPLPLQEQISTLKTLNLLFPPVFREQKVSSGSGGYPGGPAP